jgi:para-nitrobenzyl esterase
MVLFILKVFFIALFTLSVSAKAFSNAPIVQTKNGPIQGVNDQFADLYLGIPFAMPPTDGLRWEEPMRPRSWAPKVLNTTFYKPACPQPDCASRMPKESCPTEV